MDDVEQRLTGISAAWRECDYDIDAREYVIEEILWLIEQVRALRAALAEIRAEARSHDPVFRRRIVRAISGAFRKAARTVRNVHGACGKVQIEGRLDYEAFELPADQPCVLTAEQAVHAVGGRPVRAISNGGLDANWMTARGIPTVTLGSGQRNPHTVSERLEIAQFRQACRIALRLATATENSQ